MGPCWLSFGPHAEEYEQVVKGHMDMEAQKVSRLGSYHLQSIMVRC
jgi:hypothetical protein